MAISLDSKGLSLNYPTSKQTSVRSGGYPVGCLAVFRGTFTLSGTWIRFSPYSAVYQVQVDNNDFVYFRVA